MRERFEQGYLFSGGGIYCPLCGSLMARGSLICGHCRRVGRFQIDAGNVREVSREVYLPRAISRHHLRHGF